MTKDAANGALFRVLGVKDVGSGGWMRQREMIWFEGATMEA